MNFTLSATRAIPNVKGTIYRVETSVRKPKLFLKDMETELAVPPDCLIRLERDHVNLRHLRLGHQAKVGYSFVGNTACACSIQAKRRNTRRCRHVLYRQIATTAHSI
jgi:hypothetical protein